MKTQALALAAGLLATTAAGALPQDSVSKSAGLPGDAVDPYSTSEQQNDYVVDLQALTTSWGTRFGIAPVVKSSAGDPAFFNNGISSQAASATLKVEAPPARSSYSFWVADPGTGVNNNGAINDPGSPLAPPVQTSQIAAAFSEFGGAANHVVSAIVNFNPTDPSRLFVSRIQAAVNGTPANQNNAQIGFGAIDSDGNTYIRGEGFGTSGSNPLTGNNIYRVDALARNPGQLNQLLGSGPTDAGATSWLVTASTTTWNPPSNLPEDIAGRPVFIGSNFASQYGYESSAGVVATTTAHLGSASDHRGNVFFSRTPVFGGSVGTAALYGQNGSGETRLLKLWGVGPNGNVAGNTTLTTPAAITDNSTGFVFPNDLSAYPGAVITAYAQHLSQAAFRGGNGQVAVGRDQAGRVLVAAVGNADDGSSPLYPSQQNPINAMFVARFDPGNVAGTLQWTLAAYNDLPGGKPILDGPGGTPIGQVVQLDQFALSSVGPSIAPPMIDSVGNIWFLAAVETFSPADFDTALLRAVYDPASFSYELELVTAVGDVFAGVNSGRDWQVSFLPVADSNSIASSTAFSGNIVQTGFNDGDVSSLSTSDPATLGGLFLHASITYDFDDDGVFDDTLGVDQEYASLLYIGVDTPQCTSNNTEYCTAGTSASGCQAMITSSGIASASAGEGFVVSVSNLEGAKDGIFFMGQNGRQANTWGNGTSFQCVVPPVKRGGVIPGVGNNGACDGFAAQDLNALWCELCPKPHRKPIPGQKLQIQFWYRDPQNTSNQTTSLSNALEVDVCP